MGSIKLGSRLDPIPSRIFKSLLPVLRGPLLGLINGSLVAGSVPTALKQAVVIPLPKKLGVNLSDYKNFRPISFLPIASKIMERYVTQVLGDFLADQSFLCSHQAGFRAGHSTESAMLSILDDLRQFADCDQPPALILLDLSAVFDPVERDIHVSRLEATGVRGSALSWFRSFLSERSFTVYMGPFVSASRTLVVAFLRSLCCPQCYSIYIFSLCIWWQPFCKKIAKYKTMRTTQIIVRLDGSDSVQAQA